LSGFGTLEDAELPLSVFGCRHQGTSGVTDGTLQNVFLGLSDGGVVGYAGQFAIVASTPLVAPGDSGAAVRDSAGRLVGMVVGMAADGRTAWCTPWETVQASVDRIVQQNLVGEIA